MYFCCFSHQTEKEKTKTSKGDDDEDNESISKLLDSDSS
jgi:hypothetical protein